MMRVVRPAMLLAAGAALLFSGCRGDEARPTAGAPLILVSIDTLRSDRLPAYGYGAVATPRLDALAADALLFERAYSHCPLTLPSHASLFTGLLPPDHGVRDNREFELIEQRETLAEVLREAGYRTAGFVSSMVLRRSTGIAQGFEHYDDAIEKAAGRRSSRSAERSGARTVTAAADWMADLRPGEPFFLFVHLYEPHAPYEAPEPFGSQYDDAYDAEVAYSDSLVGELLDHLKRRGLYDASLIVLLSDHGEGLSDHGEREHGLLLYREALQVPLMIKLPRGRSAGRRREAPVGLVDVAPTVLALLGLVPRPGAGQALLDGDPAADRAIYSESRFGLHQYGWSELRSVIRDRLHYIEAPTPELFDVVSDPLERKDLLPVQDPPAVLLRTLVEIGAGAADRAAISAEERRQLASLGYLGGGATGGSRSGSDPRRLVHDVEQLWAFVHGDAATEQRLPDAEIQRLLDSIGGGNEYLRRMLASALQHEQRFDLALEILQPLAEAGNADTQVALAQTLISLGRLAEARSRLERALALDDELGEAHLGMGILLMTRDAFVEAEPWLARALELDAELPEAWNGIGVVRMRAGDAQGAMEAWATTVALDPELGDAWFNLAIVRHGLGDVAGAAEALERFIPLVEGSEKQRAQAMLNSLGRGS